MCEGKYLVLVSSGDGSVMSVSPLLAAPATLSPGSVGVALRQRLAPSTYRSVSVSYESLYSTLFTRLMEAHLCINGHRDLSLDDGSVVSAYNKGILGASAFYII